MKIFSPEQTRSLDKFTIEHEPIASIDLMERASIAFCDQFETWYAGERKITVFAGPGNNGGDGLAIARLLNNEAREVRICICHISNNKSDDFMANLERVMLLEGTITIIDIQAGDPMPEIDDDEVIIDAIFGSGLNRPIGEDWQPVVEFINLLPNDVVSVDAPSGLFANKPSTGSVVEADHTITFDSPKLGFFAPENSRFVGEWVAVDIGLDIQQKVITPSAFEYLDQEMASSFLHERQKFDFKGNFGHVLLIAGSKGMAGAAVLSGTAILRSGAGLLTIHTPSGNNTIVQTAIPEAMTSLDDHDSQISDIPELSRFNSIAIGCGIGQSSDTSNALKRLLERVDFPIVIDADALNIIASNPALLELIPTNSILTPHLGEFHRLVGRKENHFERLDALSDFAEKYQVVVVLKGAHTSICGPGGGITFNSTGNPGMATGGSGDVLTGIIAGILAQDYAPLQAAKLGVYLHGLAADKAVQKSSAESLIASDINDHLGIAFTSLRNQKYQ